MADNLNDVYALFSVMNMTLLRNIIQKVKVPSVRIRVYLFTLITWVSSSGFALFPLSEGGYGGTFRDVMHHYVETFSAVGLSIASMILLIVRGFKNKEYRLIAMALVSLLCQCLPAFFSI